MPAMRHSDVAGGQRAGTQNMTGVAQIAELSDEELLSIYAFPPAKVTGQSPQDGDSVQPWLRMNFITSLDGAVTLKGRSGGLGDDQDQRLLELLRRPADAIMVGWSTLEAEGYGALTLPDAGVQWRRQRGLPDHPRLVVVTRSCKVDVTSAVFTDAPVPPLVVTCANAPDKARRQVQSVAEVVTAGGADVDPALVVQCLAERRLTRIHGEGGPRVFGSCVAAGVVCELCLTVAPALVAGAAGRIAHADTEVDTRMQLRSVLANGSELFLRYTR